MIAVCVSCRMSGRRFQGAGEPEIAPQKAIGGHAELEGGLGGVIGRGRAVLLRERQHAENPAHAGGALVVVDVGADGVQRCAGVASPREQRERRTRRARGAIGVCDAMPAARCA
jgi:hypothetical protein